MKKQHPKYIVKQTDTIALITELFGVVEDIWKRYHNNMCCLDDVIKDNLPEHLKEIYLLPELWDKELVLNKSIFQIETIKHEEQPVTLGYQNTLFIKNTLNSGTYGVKIAIQDGSIVKTIKYKIAVKWLGKNDSSFLVEVGYPEDTRINDKLPDIKTDQLAVDVYKILFPIVFVVNKQGCIEDIGNYEEIKFRWENTQGDIRKYRFGELLDKYLNICSKSLSDEVKLLRKLKKNYFLYCYFFGIYQSYREQYFVKKEFEFPVLSQTENIIFSTNCKISEYQDKYGMIQVTINGELKDNSESEIFQSNNAPEEATYYAKYFVDAKTHIIDGMITKINIDKEKKITIKISNLS